ncbi:MAG TPA: acyl-CoA desaturase [Gemmatimonadales bacterium]|nr:acyl-CoA desaturase [Gemmatimonadales bacterium]
MTAGRITFPQRDPTRFIEDLRARVADYFESRRLSPKANAAMIAKTITLLGLTFGAYGLILTNRLGPWPMLGLAIVVGVGVAGLGFSVAHDALHGAYSHDARVNAALGFVFNLIGANGYIWKITHNVIHHTYTNIPGIDGDLEVSPLVRLSPHAAWKPIHRWQHLYAIPLYGLSTLFWVFIKDYKYFLKRHLGPYHHKHHSAGAVATLLGSKALYYGWSIVIPLLVLDVAWWQFVIGYVAMHLTAGLLLGIVFQLAHSVEGPAFPSPDERGAMEHAWAVHEMETTSDFGRHNRLLNWYVGGLNFQIEHHLFPKVCSIHYPALSAIVEATAREHGIVYHEHATFRAAVRSHYRMLRRLGRPPEAAPDAPAPPVPGAPAMRPA